MNKVVIVGCGNVGMSYAYALLNQNTYVHELVLIDIDKKKAEGEAMDLNHCLAFAPSKMKIKVGDYQECGNAKIVVIAAGANQNPGETRMDLIYKNSKIFKSIVGSIMDTDFKGILLVATNPLDVMTYLTWKYSGLNKNQVIGTGTSLDSSRLRYLVSEKLQISPKNVHAYVIGEHGDSEFVCWSNANIGLQNINQYLNKNEMQEIYEEVRDSAYQIIERKGNTCYGIGMCLVRITSAILSNENAVVTVSNYDSENNIFISVPAIINSKGIAGRIYVHLNKDETRKLQSSVDTIKEAINKLK